MADPERPAMTQRTGRARRTLENLGLAPGGERELLCDSRRAGAALACDDNGTEGSGNDLFVLQPSSLAPRILIEAANYYFDD